MYTRPFARRALCLLPILLLLSGAHAQNGPLDLDDGTTGEHIIQGLTTASVSGGSNTNNNINHDLTKPAAPVATPSITSIGVTWTPSNKRQVSSEPTTVTIEWADSTRNFNVLWTGAYGSVSTVKSGLAPSSVYYFRAYVGNSFGNSVYSDEVSATTLSGGSTTAVISTPASDIVNTPASTQGSAKKGLNGGVIAGIVIAALATVAAIIAIIAKTASKAAAPVASHWLDSAAQNPLYVDGEQAFENPMYEPPAEAGGAV